MAAEGRALKPNRIEEIEIVGAKLADVKVPDFKRSQVSAGSLGLESIPWYQRILRAVRQECLYGQAQGNLGSLHRLRDMYRGLPGSSGQPG